MSRLLAMAVICCALGGCATVHPKATGTEANAADTESKSIVLLAIDVFRPDDSRYVPIPSVVKVENANAQSKEDRRNFMLDRNVDSKAEDGHCVYLARMALAPGRYRLSEARGNIDALPVYSVFVVPLLLSFEVKANSISYVGRVTAKLRPRNEGEFRAGPIIPFIDQYVSGLSNGTWDVTVDDMSSKDIALFRATYPALATAASIEITPLPPFDRAAVQRWWDGQPAHEQTPAEAHDSRPTGGK